LPEELPRFLLKKLDNILNGKYNLKSDFFHNYKIFLMFKLCSPLKKSEISLLFSGPSLCLVATLFIRRNKRKREKNRGDEWE